MQVEYVTSSFSNVFLVPILNFFFSFYQLFPVSNFGKTIVPGNQLVESLVRNRELTVGEITNRFPTLSYRRPVILYADIFTKLPWQSPLTVNIQQ